MMTTNKQSPGTEEFTIIINAYVDDTATAGCRKDNVMVFAAKEFLCNAYHV